MKSFLERNLQVIAKIRAIATSITTSAALRHLEQASLLNDAAQATDREACVVCPHKPASHDAIAARFCSATRDGAIVRGCVCQS